MALEIETRLKTSAQELVNRGREAVATLMERLQSFNKKADGKIIKDTLIKNLEEVAHLIEDMNITRNSDIYDMAWKIRRLSKVSAAGYRYHPQLRTEGLSLGEAILKEQIDLDTLDLEVSEMVAEAGEYEF